MKRNRNIGSLLLMAAGLLLMAAALYELIPALLAYKREDDTYEALRDAYVAGQPGAASDDQEEGEELPAWYEVLQVDFETLKEANPDVTGWIYFDNIEQIDYPVLYSGDDETYLHTDLYGNASKSGCIFMEGNNVPDFNDCHTILYGHNMKNGSMFGSLKQYKNDGFYEKMRILPWLRRMQPTAIRFLRTVMSRKIRMSIRPDICRMRLLMGSSQNCLSPPTRIRALRWERMTRF